MTPVESPYEAAAIGSLTTQEVQAQSTANADFYVSLTPTQQTQVQQIGRIGRLRPRRRFRPDGARGADSPLDPTVGRRLPTCAGLATPLFGCRANLGPWRALHCVEMTPAAAKRGQTPFPWGASRGPASCLQLWLLGIFGIQRSLWLDEGLGRQFGFLAPSLSGMFYYPDWLRVDPSAFSFVDESCDPRIRCLEHGISPRAARHWPWWPLRRWSRFPAGSFPCPSPPWHVPCSRFTQRPSSIRAHASAI